MLHAPDVKSHLRTRGSSHNPDWFVQAQVFRLSITYRQLTLSSIVTRILIQYLNTQPRAAPTEMRRRQKTLHILLHPYLPKIPCNCKATITYSWYFRQWLMAALRESCCLCGQNAHAAGAAGWQVRLATSWSPYRLSCLPCSPMRIINAGMPNSNANNRLPLGANACCQPGTLTQLPALHCPAIEGRATDLVTLQ